MVAEVRLPFHVGVSVEARIPDPQQLAEAAVAARRSVSDPVRVLVVDDEPLARMRIEDVLAHIDGAQIVGTARERHRGGRADQRR